MKREMQDLFRSIRDPLLNQARARNEEFQNFLMRYALERWLYRLSLTKHREQFVLMLFAIWNDEPHRPTQDLDLLGFGSSSINELEVILREICAVAATEDGLQFQPDSVSGSAIREENIYLPVPRLRAYRRETVIAEKFNAMVQLELRNSRLKDFYDLWAPASTCDFEGETLSESIRATFERRRTPLPLETPVALTDEFATAKAKQTQWRVFVRHGKLQAGEVSLEEVIKLLHGFLMPAREPGDDASLCSDRGPETG
ncbi:MAG TPA: nucleotidyl transferase AbiEii/AbiGii toxin family protein [Blastocatellia bacterium]|nr:nucleotidyl transferase AbiEii/AbiGii toxin family protein [Blastocatellia bacterium]